LRTNTCSAQDDTRPPLLFILHSAFIILHSNFFPAPRSADSPPPASQARSNPPATPAAAGTSSDTTAYPRALETTANRGCIAAAARPASPARRPDARPPCPP